jgi:hypothetical protein
LVLPALLVGKSAILLASKSALLADKPRPKGP